VDHRSVRGEQGDGAAGARRLSGAGHCPKANSEVRTPSDDDTMLAIDSRGVPTTQHGVNDRSRVIRADDTDRLSQHRVDRFLSQVARHSSSSVVMGALMA
jgi:hypothetical protein